MIGILDYGVGNVGAFQRIYHSQNVPTIAISRPSHFEGITKLILPGVGAFDTAMTKLNESGLRLKLDEMVVGRNMPLLGVCIGMHMLGNKSEEGSIDGLGYIKGCTRIHRDKDVPLPHMGWNDVSTRYEDRIWDGIDTLVGFYFLHSYVFEPESEADTFATSEYGSGFVSAIKSAEIYGFQFHPEKSLTNGTNLLVNFAKKDVC